MTLSKETETRSPAPSNFDLKEDIRDYWSKRSETFDLAFGHRIPAGPEFDAWQKPVRDLLGEKPLNVLELACGTGEVTAVIHALGHTITALDFSQSMLSVARQKHAGKGRLRFILADAENTMEADGTYDAIICRHLVWTLTDPPGALRKWHRLLKPGGKVLVFDGDWSKPKPTGRIASWIIQQIDRFIGADANYDGALSDRHARIMQRLPFGDGLTTERLLPVLEQAGFVDAKTHSHGPIAAAQRQSANVRNMLRTFVYQRFIVLATKPR